MDDRPLIYIAGANPGGDPSIREADIGTVPGKGHGRKKKHNNFRRGHKGDDLLRGMTYTHHTHWKTACGGEHSSALLTNESAARLWPMVCSSVYTTTTSDTHSNQY